MDGGSGISENEAEVIHDVVTIHHHKKKEDNVAIIDVIENYKITSTEVLPDKEYNERWNDKDNKEDDDTIIIIILNTVIISLHENRQVVTWQGI